MGRHVPKICQFVEQGDVLFMGANQRYSIKIFSLKRSYQPVIIYFCRKCCKRTVYPVGYNNDIHAERGLITIKVVPIDRQKPKRGTFICTFLSI